MYRPDGWKNPLADDKYVPSSKAPIKHLLVGAYEAGADAMLEALGEMTYGNIYDKDWYINRSKGKWVFIPDKE